MRPITLKAWQKNYRLWLLNWLRITAMWLRLQLRLVKIFCPGLLPYWMCHKFRILTEVVDNSTFVRPIYAGNAFETVQSNSEKLVLTFRATAFDAAGQGGNAEVVNVEATPAQNLSRFVNRQLSQSDRPGIDSGLK